MAKESKYERQEVVPASGGAGLSPLYHHKEGERLPRVEYDRSARWFGYLVAAILIGALAAVYLLMLASGS